MSAVAFVQSLLESGRVKVPPRPALPKDLDDAVAMLDAAARPEMAYEPPPLSTPAAVWALTVLYRACQVLVFRETEAKVVQNYLTHPCPEPPSAAVCYSADLSMRYLPDVVSLARAIAPGDPLVTGLMALARAWPLSSVGIAGLEGVDPSPFLDDRSLRQLYVDRIIDRGDASRLAHPMAKSAVREAIGACPQLAPKLAPAL